MKSLTPLVAIAILSVGVAGCAATGASQEQTDAAMRAAQDAKAAADRAQATANEAKALAQQANEAAEANSKKVDRAFVKSQQK